MKQCTARVSALLAPLLLVLPSGLSAAAGSDTSRAALQPGAHAAAGVAAPIRFMRDPHISHGRIVFSYMGDIWIARDDGADARRLTAHVARDVSPRFSPDGQAVAFTSNRMGNNDVFVVAASGGEARQLTFFTGDDDVQYWTPDGRGIVITTSRGPHPFGSPLHVVPVDGGLPVPLGMDFGRAGMIRQDGAMIAFNRNAFPQTRQGYRGNNSTDVWVQDLATGAITQLTDPDVRNYREHTHDAVPMWGADGQIYFLSERSGVYNIWRIAPGGGAPAQVTFHETGGVQFPAISPDGGAIIYTQDHELHVLRLGERAEPRRVPVLLAYDPKDNLVEYIAVQSRAEGFAPSPDGESVAVDFRGEIFIVPSEADLGEKTQVTRSAWRDRQQQYSPDGRLLAYVSDESGEDEIWVYDIASGARRQLTSHASQKTSFVWAPDASRIAFVAANRLFEVDVRSARTTELGFNQAGGYALAEYSADGRWLVYGRSDDAMNADVYLFDIANRREHNATAHPFRDSGGLLTPDGRTLIFTSNRDGGTNHLFAVSLQRLRADPADPLVLAQRRASRAGDDAAGSRAADGAGRGAAAPPPAAPAPPAEPIRLELDGIGRRAVQLTSGTNAVGSYFLSRDGRTIYFTSSDDEGPALFSIGIDGRERRRVAAGRFADVTPTHDRRYVFFSQEATGTGSEVHRMQLSNQRRERVTFGFDVEVDLRGEWEQIFEESWRVMRYRFYDENMHGVDWDAVRTRYKPLLAHTGSYEDAYFLANLMIGELNASHTGVSGPPSRAMPRGYSSRFLGFELEPADGRYRISHIYRDGPADREWLGLGVGDYVLAIDGTELRAPDNYWEVLNRTLNEFVTVRVARSANGAAARDVRIQSITSLTDVRYEDWVARNREFVERESDGRIAYVHIRAMNQPSLRRFENEIDRFWNAEGIVVDIRYNGGGNIDQELLDILKREPYQYWNNRWASREWGRRWRRAIAGPKVMLINHRSGSDSEVTPMGFRQLGIGTIVGNPTAAAVIATGSHALIHGGSIRTPGSLVATYDPTQPNNYGINLENYGVPPDVWVVNSPADELRGFDRELKTAVDEALRQLAERRYQYRAEDR